MLGNFIFLGFGLFIGTMFGCVLGENSEKDKRIQDLRRQIRENEAETETLTVEETKES